MANDLGALFSFVDTTLGTNFLAGQGKTEEFNEETPLEKLAVGGELFRDEEIEWIWPGRIPLGFLTALVGPRGVGKSLVLADIAARVTRGFPWPDDPFGDRRVPAKPATVLYITTEDSLAKMTVPRLKKAGADLANVKLIRYPRVNACTWSKPRANEVKRWRLIAKKVPDLKLIIIDGFVPLLGSANNRRNQELGEFLSLIAGLAEECDVAVLIANTSDKLGAGKSWSSGVDVVAHLQEHARMVWEIEPNHEKTKNKLLLPVQVGLDDDPGGLAFKVHPEHGCVVWHEENVPIFAGSRPTSRARAQSQVNRAIPWLYEYLRERPAPAATILVDGAVENLGARALRSAKDILGVRSNKLSGKFGLGWEWELPSPYEDVRPGSPPREGVPKAPMIAKYWLRGLGIEKDAGIVPVDAAKAPEADKVTRTPNFGVISAKAPEDDKMIANPNVAADLPVCLPNKGEVGGPGGLPPREDEDDKMTADPNAEANLLISLPNKEEDGRPGGLPPREEDQIGRPGGLPPREENQIGRPGGLPPRDREDAKVTGEVKRPEWFDEDVPGSGRRRPKPEPLPTPIRPKPQHIIDLEARLLDSGITELYLWGGPEDFPDDFPNLKPNVTPVSDVPHGPGPQAGGALPSGSGAG